MRVGTGFDVHRLVKGRRLVLGGVEIDFDKGLLGHSDADVLVHAVCDALLGGAALGDIGEHFPDSDVRFKNIESLALLWETVRMLSSKGYAIENIDATLMAQAPKISAYKKTIRENIARTCGISIDKVNVKATTTEGLGFIGKGEGMAASCVAMLSEISG